MDNKIWILEGEASLRDRLARVAALAGWATETPADINAAVDALEWSSPPCWIVISPWFDGLPALAAWRTLKGWKELSGCRFALILGPDNAGAIGEKLAEASCLPDDILVVNESDAVLQLRMRLMKKRPLGGPVIAGEPERSELKSSEVENQVMPVPTDDSSVPNEESSARNEESSAPTQCSSAPTEESSATTVDSLALGQKLDDSSCQREAETSPCVPTSCNNLEMDLAISERLAEAESFSHAVAHDMSGSLNNIKALTKRAQQKIKEPLALEKYLGKIVACTDQALEMVKGLYQLSGLTKNRMEMREFFVDEIVRKALSNIQGKDRAAELVVAIDCPARMTGSPEMLLLVFQNLASNALKYIPRDRPPEIRVSTEEKDGRLKIAFEDNGNGIPEGQRERIFRPFERLHGDDITGLGLGLSIVRRIVEQHGGTIRVDTGTNLSGAKFVISIPIRRNDA